MTTPTRARVRLPILLGSMALLLAAPARAQQVATSFEELRNLVKQGDTIYVTDTRGATIKGKLAGLSTSSLESWFSAVPSLGRCRCRNAMSITSCSNASIRCGMGCSLGSPRALSPSR